MNLDENIISKLEDFRELIIVYYNKPTSNLRSQISRSIPYVERIVNNAGTGKRLTIAPPAMVSGYKLTNVNPFTLIFNAPYGIDITSTIVDIIDQTIGVVESGQYVSSKEVMHENNTDKLTISNKKVFIVHGHDAGLKETTARFIDKVGLRSIILHEQANNGKTIIEKFESNSDVAYAVILLSPDDLGRSVNDDPDTFNFRARQNVIFELGYFIAKLGRENVCAIIKGPIETPSDYDGILYLQFDNADAWKLLLAKEMKNAGLAIDLNLVV